MTFRSGSEQVIHVVSYPSVWLSVDATVRILMLGYTEKELMQLVPTVQSQDHVSMTWYVCEPDHMHIQAELDWCMCMSVMSDLVVCKPHNLTQLAMASHLRSPVSHWIPSECQVTRKLQQKYRLYDADLTTWLLHACETIKDDPSR